MLLAVTLAVILAVTLAACGGPEPFTPGPVELTVKVEGPGSVTSSPAGIDCGAVCTETFAAGTQVVLTAKQSATAEFNGWGGGCTGAAPSCTVTLDDDKTVTARFGDTVIVVNSTAGSKTGPDCTLRAAIEAANTDTAVAGCHAGDGDDIIRLPPGAVFDLEAVDNTTNGRNALPSVRSRINIQGNGSTVQRGATEDQLRLFHVSQDGYLTIENLTIRNGDGDTFGGGGIYVAGGRLELLETNVTENDASHDGQGLGAGLLARGGIVSVQSSRFTNNFNSFGSPLSGSSGTAIAIVDGALTMRDSEISGNVSGFVAGIHLFGEHTTADIARTTIANNDGLAIVNEGSLWLTDSNLRRNSLSEGSGGMRNSGAAYLERVTYEQHWAEASGSLQNSGFMSLAESTISRNSAGYYGRGGGIYNSGTMEIYDTVITENDAGDSSETGGGVHNDGEMLVAGSHIIGNRSGHGGGIWNEGSLTLLDTVVDGNRAYGLGGGAINLSSLRLEGATTIGGDRGNSAEAGGGVYSGLEWKPSDPRSISLHDTSSISNNRAAGDGGGIYAFGHLALQICDTCSITANQADSDGDGEGHGGGVYGTEVFIPADAAGRVFDNSPDDMAP